MELNVMSNKELNHITLPLECIQRHMESDRETQLDYDILSLNEKDAPAVSEFDVESDLGIAWSGSCSSLAKYLTKKGARIDDSIKWGSMPSSVRDNEKTVNKRSCCDQATFCEPSRKRRATVGNLAADLQFFKEVLDASISGDEKSQCEEVYLTIGGSVQSVQGMLSRAAKISSLEDTKHQVDYQDLNSIHQCWHAVNPECSQPAASAKTIHRIPSAESCASEMSLYSTSDLRSLRSYSASRTPSMRLSTHTARQVTVLSIDIKGFTSACATMPAGHVGEWVAEFYERVDAVAAAHGVTKAEVRGDCCICVAGAAGAVPSRAFAPAPADPPADQATRMLAFAAALHHDLRTLSAGGAATATRMGIATGEASFLVSDAGPGAGAAHFVSVQGDAAALAARMESLAAPGAVRVHRSAALRWAAEARCPPPPTACVDCGAGGGLQRAAVFDCAAGAFRPALDGAAGPASAAGGHVLRRSASAPL